MASHVQVIEQMAATVTPAPVEPAALPEVTLTMPDVPLRSSQLSMQLTEDQLKRLEGLPVKVAPRVRLLMQRGIDARSRRDVAAGRNPFPDDTNRYMWLACEMLLHGGFNRSSLKNAFIAQLKFTPATAASHVSNTVAIFNALGICLCTPSGNFVPIQDQTKKISE